MKAPPWWFALLLAGTAAGIAYAAYRYRLNQMLRLERIRTRIATDLHDDIGASLSQIAVLSEVARMDADRGVRVQEPLFRCGKSLPAISQETVPSSQIRGVRASPPAALERHLWP